MTYEMWTPQKRKACRNEDVTIRCRADRDGLLDAQADAESLLDMLKPLNDLIPRAMTRNPYIVENLEEAWGNIEEATHALKCAVARLQDGLNHRI